MASRQEGRESYYKRWRREHPRLQVYLSREEYEWLRGVAEARGASMKEVVLEAIRRLRSYEEGYLRGFYDAVDLFIDDPYAFYERVVRRARARGLKDFEPALFTAPCMHCGGPMVFTHRASNWDRVRGILRRAFSNWHHVGCG